MAIDFYIVNAFTQDKFGGNPAAVCPLDSWLDDDLMQNIAVQHNLSETAFFVLEKDKPTKLRWFTPSVEVEFCGHATLASAHVILSTLAPQRSEIKFATKKGELLVKKHSTHANYYEMTLPLEPSTPYTAPALLLDGIRAKPQEAWQGANIMLVYENQKAIEALSPDWASLKAFCAEHNVGIIATAKGDEVDFVSRFFAPAHGINEDPVTGSAHCQLAPYWLGKLGKAQMSARQLSSRGGELDCVLDGDKVLILGGCVPFSYGAIDLTNFEIE